MDPVANPPRNKLTLLDPMPHPVPGARPLPGIPAVRGTMPNRVKTSRVYRLYGLTVSAPWELPGLPLADPGGADVEVTETDAPLSDEPFDDETIGANGHPVFSLLADGGVRLAWPGLSECVVSADGHKVTVHALAGVPRMTILAYPLTQALSFALIRMGREPLHATTVRIGDSAVGIMGDCGYGKSTLAAAFVARGFGLLSDDLLVADVRKDRVFVCSGFARLKLSPEMADALLGNSFKGTELAPVTDKRMIDVGSNSVAADRVPLDMIYVLGNPSERCAGDRVTVRPLSGSKSLMQLIGNTYNDVITGRKRLSSQLAHAAAMVKRVPVKSLRYPRSLERLGEVCDTILADSAIID